MDSKELLLILSCLCLMGGLRLTSTTTTTTFVAAMSIANQDLERYFRTTNASQTLSAAMTEERYASLDLYTYAFLNYTHWTAEQQQIDVQFEEEKARYGEGLIKNVRGKLVHITDAGQDGVGGGADYACSANILGTRGEPTPPFGVTWIALVRRGRCTFEEKVKYVHAKGAAGVIIYNDKPVPNLEKMKIQDKKRNITAVITYQQIGLDMAILVDQGNEMIISITKGREGSRPINSLNRTSVLFVSISFIVLMIISLVWLIFYYIQKFRYLQTKDQQSRMLCSVTKKAIMKIPTKTGKISDEKDADSDCCAICIEAYKPSDCIRVLPCKHEFHKNCIDPWLIEHRTCPMCKLDVLKFYGYVFLGSEESILEYEPDRSAATNATVAAAASSVQSTAGVASTQPRSSALTDLIRSRDFVIDFPRFFVLDTVGASGGGGGTRESLFPQRLPERSQSTLTLAANATKDWMSQLSNKLDDQHGLRRVRKSSTAAVAAAAAGCAGAAAAGVGGRYEMQEKLLGVRDSAKKRRSRSADGRFTNGCFARRELARQQAAAAAAQQEKLVFSDSETDAPAAAAGLVEFNSAPASSRRSSSALRLLTDASYAQSIHRRREELQRRNSAIPTPTADLLTATTTTTSGQQALRRASAAERSDVTIQIQVNGEGVDF